MGARFAPCVPHGFSAGRQFFAGGRWPPLREGPYVQIAFRDRRRGAHWAPVLSCAFCMVFCGRAILLSRAAGGRPYAKAPSVRLASRSRRRGAQWAPVLSCTFCMAFCGRAILLSAGGRWPPLREVPICAARFSAPLRNETHRQTPYRSI